MIAWKAARPTFAKLAEEAEQAVIGCRDE